MSIPRRFAALFALLMVLSSAAFVIGAMVEKNQGHAEPSIEQTHSDEGSEGHEESNGEPGEGTESHAEESETIGGINTESTPLIVLGAALSMALAGAVLRWPRREVFGVAVVFCFGFAVLDGRELAHQLDEDSGIVAAFAGLTLVLHLAAAAVAAVALSRTFDRSTRREALSMNASSPQPPQ